MRLSFDDIATHFNDQRGLPPEAIRAWMGLIHELAGNRQLRIIEPGIGTGRISLPLAAMGHHITGTDISVPMLTACEHSANELNITSHLDLIEADATDLPIADHSFDLGVIAQLLYLVPDWPTALDEVARVVRPGGHIIHLTEPTSEGDALALWSRTWREMIEATGYRHTDLAPTEDEVNAEFLRRWPDTEARELATWSFGQTIAEAMHGYANRLRPLYSEVADETFAQVVDEFLTWASQSFPHEGTELNGTVTFTARIAVT